MMQTTGDRVTGSTQRPGEQPAGVQKTRVYEVAKDVGLSNKDLVDKIRALGIEVKNHMSALEAEDVARVKRALEKERQENTVVERIQPTVIRRRNKNAPEAAAVPRAATPGATATSIAPSAAAPPSRVRGEAVETPTPPLRRRPVAPEGPASGPGSESPRRVAASPEGAQARHLRESREGDGQHGSAEGALGAASPGGALGPPSEDETAVEARRGETRAHGPRPLEAAPGTESVSGRTAEDAGADEAVAARGARGDDDGEAEARETASARARTGIARPARPAGSVGPVPVGDEREVSQGSPVVDSEQSAAASAGPVAGQRQAGTDGGEARPRQKTQFEQELERAREAAAAKQAALAAQKASEPAQPSAPGRPAVGSIIELPLPRIQITERGPGGRPLPPGARSNAPQTVIPGAGQVRGRYAEAQRSGGRKPDMKGGLAKKAQLAPGKKARTTQITTPAEHKRVIKMEENIAVSELAHQMGVKATEVLKKLWSMGMVGVNINQSIDFDTSSLLANEFGYEVQNTAFQETTVFSEAQDAPEDLEPRAPVVTVMGHVDHGKTSLLDAIRHTDVAAGEAGGITQHIGAYRVSAAGIGDVVFLDTPGHAAFTAMRARGAQATDIVVLVVAADDGVMPQTVEALNHAKDAKVPIVVAVNKIDKPSANPDRIRQQLAEHNLIPEEWGGDTQYVNVSAYSKAGIDKLLESIQLQAEILELKANPKKLAKGVVVEAKLDRNRGPMATVLVQEGTLRVGDIIVSGEHMGKVRAMLNDKGSMVQEAPPSTPVEVLGLDGVPEAGDVMNGAADEKAAKTVVEHRREQRRKKEMAVPGKLSLENVLEKIQEGQVRELKIVLKADVQGSAEALREALSKLTTNEVRVNVIQAGVGGITESDVNLAKAGGAIILGFHVRPAGKAAQLAEQEGVDIKLYDIIYDAIDDVKKGMVGLLAPVKKERALGKVEVREIFNIPKVGTVAGCFVSEGKVTRQAQVRLVRDAVQVYGGRLGSLKRFKDDVREVTAGYECGLTIEGYNDVKIGDVIEAYEIVEEAPTL
jgi:translation initiation factor IF-2